MLICHVHIFFSEVYVTVFGPFLNWLFSYHWVSRILCVFWVVFLYHMWSFAVFSLSLWLVLKFSWYCFLQSRSFKFYFIFESLGVGSRPAIGLGSSRLAQLSGCRVVHVLPAAMSLPASDTQLCVWSSSVCYSHWLACLLPFWSKRRRGAWVLLSGLKIHFSLFQNFDPIRWNSCILGVNNKGKSMKWPLWGQ